MSTDDTRTRILNAAGPVFAEKGFSDATVRDICQAANVNVASVNYHFGDKEQLYIATVTQARALRVQQVQFPSWSAETPPDEKLRDYLRTMITRMLGTNQAPWQLTLMMREVLHPTAACKALVKDHFRPDFDLLVGILREILPEETPAYKLHLIGFSILGQCLHYRVAGEVVAIMIDEQERHDHYSVPQLAEHIAEFSLAALGCIASYTNRSSSESGRTIPAPIHSRASTNASRGVSR